VSKGAKIAKIFISPRYRLKIRQYSPQDFRISKGNIYPGVNPLRIHSITKKDFENSGPSSFDVIVAPYIVTVGDGIDRVYRVSTVNMVNPRLVNEGVLLFIE
jgi:hypothetical protein